MTVEERMEICKACPLYKVDPTYGAICDKSKYLSPDGKDWSYKAKPGWVRGCACTLRHKQKNPKAHCPAKKW